MQHLTLEVLARLVDEPPLPAEAEHLAGCPACAGELEAIREQTDGLRRLPDLAPPPGGWWRLRLEIGGAPRWRSPAVARFGRMAAGIVLFLAGAGLGAAANGGSVGAGIAPDAPGAASLEGAAAELRAAESEYLRAITRYAELTETGDGLDPLNRLAALESIVLTTRAALRDAPADPVINNYHLIALAQREALLRRLETGGGDEWF
jgi:hypothetical protein